MSQHPTSSFPRTQLDASVTSEIDKSLKDLKRCTKRLSASIDLFNAEYALLERIYYKGKNQHRAAIFWKRVVEVRRYATRLNSIAFPTVLHKYQSSFFDPAASENPKLLKGAWTHYPSPEIIKSSQRSLSTIMQLTGKMHQRTQNAFEVLTQAMQTGAFLQFVLILTAITSRMSLLASELYDIASEISGIVLQTGVSLHGFSASKARKDIRGPAVPSVSALPSVDDEAELGMVIERNEDEISATKVSSVPEVDISPAFQQPIIEREVIPRQKIKTASRPEKPQKPRKQKARDAIDDIFGF